MSDKLYQVVDNVHGTIYYSELEKEIIGTPFFNRLHDVNQSSTVYFTFPPNRTKRYEHSLGTMQVTSDVFYNAVVNAMGDDACKCLFKKATESFEIIFGFFHSRKRKYPLDLVTETRDGLSIIGLYSFSEVQDIIRKNFLNSFSQTYLLQFIPKSLNDDFEAFLFLVLIQALRIVGLLHDCGHPPQSHIIESVLNEIYDELPDEAKQTIRQKNFREILDTYRDTQNEQLQEIDTKMAIKTEGVFRDHLHEMIGLQVIFNIFNNVLPPLINRDIEVANKKVALVKSLYNLSLYEFVFAIVRNKTTFWKSLHEIIDGVIDTDRLDFVGRDAKNSGMDWGSVPFKRIVNSAKLVCVNNLTGIQDDIRVCFSEKSMDSMDELLRDRYKIFAYINYHHRSTRIATLYQLAVKLIALDYLNSPENDSSVPPYIDISGLWRAIELIYSPRETILNFIQWSDSWLNGLLCQKLVELNSSRIGCLTKDMDDCKRYLEEIFLNRKGFLSLIKRNTEQREINNIILNKSSSLIRKLESEKASTISKNIKIQRALKTITQASTRAKHQNTLAQNAILLQQLDLIDSSISACKWNDLEKHLGDFYSNSIKTVLGKYGMSSDDFIIKRVSFSLGLSDDAFVYDYNNSVRNYIKCSTIKPELLDAHKNFPYYYIFIISNKNKTGKLDFKSLREEIGVEVSRQISDKCKKNFHL